MSTNDVALYRKYRPQSFKDVLGQDHVVKALQGALEQGSIAHAYLFAGSRGTGKTSVARIFAEAIGTSPNDLYEIDAASNRGIDDIREIRDGVNVLPLESKFKVYIVDEVHMLTKEAFNALLKTLEEPPKHVIFILATTEIEKLPETVVSRCQTFTFKKPNHVMLHDLVIKIAKKEGFTLDGAGADLIALLGDGSFRDTQGILQKVISSSSDKKITLEEVENVTGAPKNTLVNEVVSSVVGKDLDLGLSAVGRAAKQNIDMKVFAKLIIEKLRFALLMKFSPHTEANLKERISEDDLAFLKKIAAEKESPITSSTLLEILAAYDMTGHAYVSELPLELALIKIIKGDK